MSILKLTPKLALPAFSMLFSLSFAQDIDVITKGGDGNCLLNGEALFCDWEPNQCWKLDDMDGTTQSTCEARIESCINNAKLYVGGTGTAGTCSGGTQVTKINDGTTPEPGLSEKNGECYLNGIMLVCNWDTRPGAPASCWKLNDKEEDGTQSNCETRAKACIGGNNSILYVGSTGGTNGTCSGGTTVALDDLDGPPPPSAAETFAAEIEDESENFKSLEQTDFFGNITEEKAAAAGGAAYWEKRFEEIINSEIISRIGNYADMDITAETTCTAPKAETIDGGENGISGTCTTDFEIKDSEEKTATATITVTINPAGYNYWQCTADQILVGEECKDKTEFSAPVLTITALPDGKVGAAYNFTLTATSNIDVAWVVTGLPAGLSVATSTGIISGTPTAATTAPITLTIKATNAVDFVEDEFELSIAKGNGATVSAPAKADATTTESSITIKAVPAPANGQTVEYAISNNTSAPETGWQTGLTFEGLDSETSYYVYARAKENANYLAGTANRSLSITTDIDCGEQILVGGECKDKADYLPVFGFTELKEGKVGVAYRDTLKATSTSSLPVTWTATGLPAGLSVAASTGIISGTPTAATADPVTVTIKAANSVLSVEDDFTITIAKGNGATLTVFPSLNTKTQTSITINAIPAPSNGQFVEYAYGATITAPESAWQRDTTFTGLTAGTIYYIFARAQEDANYLVGAVTFPTALTTDAPSTPILSSEFAVINSQIPEYYNLKGTPLGIQKPSVPGIYIVKQGSVFKKIAVK